MYYVANITTGVIYSQHRSLAQAKRKVSKNEMGDPEAHIYVECEWCYAMNRFSAVSNLCACCGKHRVKCAAA